MVSQYLVVDSRFNQAKLYREESRDDCRDIISMPDKWEYPWFAAWDMAFHALPLAMIDPAFAKQQLSLFLESRYQHPNGRFRPMNGTSVI